MSKPFSVKGIKVESEHYSTGHHYGLDIENKLSQMLTDELTKSIDAQILQTIMNQGKPVMRADKIKSILEKIKSSE
jgi:hypothetical protein